MVLALSLIFVFATGAAVGSFLNVCIARLPLEKSLLWPNSRCGACHEAIRWYDNLPILSYLWLRGRCRSCGQSYSIVYMLVELATALAFVGLFWIEVVQNVHAWPGHDNWAARVNWYPATSWLGFAWHALLLSFLIVASVCDLKSREIPLQLTMTGTLIGLIGSVLMPWPWPHTVGLIVPANFGLAPEAAWQFPEATINSGIYAWPFWGPLPSWCEPGGNWQTGLMTGVVGALVGTFLLRSIGFLVGKALGKEALGLGDADLMMMAGSFLGWQIVAVAFFLSVFPALLFVIIQLCYKNDNSLPFGPSLAFSVMATCLAWGSIGDFVRPAIFWGFVLFWGVILCGSMLFGMAFLWRLIRGQEEPTP